MISPSLKLFPLLFEISTPQELPSEFRGLYAFTTAMEKVLGIQINWEFRSDTDTGLVLRKSKNAYIAHYNPAKQLSFAGNSHDLFHLLTVNMAQHFSKLQSPQEKKPLTTNKNNVKTVKPKRVQLVFDLIKQLYEKYNIDLKHLKLFQNEIQKLLSDHKLAMNTTTNPVNESQIFLTRFRVELRNHKEQMFSLLSFVVEANLRKELIDLPFLNYPIKFEELEQVAQFIGDSHFRTVQPHPQYEAEEIIGNYIGDVDAESFTRSLGTGTIPKSIKLMKPIDINRFIKAFKASDYERTGINLSKQNVKFKSYTNSSEQKSEELAIEKAEEIKNKLLVTLKQVLEQYNKNLVRMGLV